MSEDGVFGMFVGIMVIVLAVIVAQMRRTLIALERRVATLEGIDAVAPPSVAELIRRETELRKAARAPIEPPVAIVPQAPAPAEPAPDPVVAPPAPVADAIEPATLEPAAAVPIPEPARPSPRIGFEELFGRRLPIWAGGITLAVAGMLIVKYSIDAGLLSPIVRVICGLLFGSALIGGAEAARRNAARVRDPRVAQALAGAGLSSLYASILIAANLYHLIGPATGFVGLAGVTALAMGLSLRFGAPSALLGLVGGLAAPALVGSAEPDIPLLTTYLALAVGGLTALSRGRGWTWLGIGALAGGFGWGALLLVGGALDAVDAVSIGLYLILLGIGLPLLVASGRLATIVHLAGATLAAVQLAALVASGGFTLLHWGLFGLITVAMQWLAQREAGLARLPAVALAIALLLLAAWPQPTPGTFALVGILFAILHAGPALWRLWRAGGGLVEAGQIAAIALVGVGIAVGQYYRADAASEPFGLLALAAALLPAGAAALGWDRAERRDDARFAALATSAALLLAFAGLCLAPLWAVAPIVSTIALGLLLLGLRANDRRIDHAARAFAVAGLALLAAGNQADREFLRMVGELRIVDLLPALVRWGGLTGIAAVFACRARTGADRAVAQGAAALLAYGMLAQIVPATPLPLVPAIGLAGCGWAARRLPAGGLLPAMGSLLAIILSWAALPLLAWFGGAMLSVAGEPLLASVLPTLRDTLHRLLAPALLVAAAWGVARGRNPRIASHFGLGAAIVLGGVAAHILFKQAFALASLPAFVRFGFAERTLWEALLFGIAVAVWRFVDRRAGRAAAAAALAHFGWYSLLLHNPLWAEQAVGALPVVNWLLPAYGLPLLVLTLALRQDPPFAGLAGRVAEIAQMALIPLFAVSLLRQNFAGPVPVHGAIGDVEDIARSVLMVALGVAYLLWGIRRSARDWRIASLLLMLGAVGKVFLFDASGLDGLARIGSFVALGFSLIGIGWLYSRYLTVDGKATGQG